MGFCKFASGSLESATFQGWKHWTPLDTGIAKENESVGNKDQTVVFDSSCIANFGIDDGLTLALCYRTGQEP